MHQPRRLAFALVLAPLLALGALAAHAHDDKDSAHGDKEIQADIQRHRAMASAHEAAAKCLESGKGHDQCEKELQAACKGLAIGKYCGMKHQH
ncbi:hypothetical protein [Paracidovorax anthurii]|uniref:PsiF repeat-containing protein n=1 Tax=Paracidovorax anthurii TaxID=78229 RepID=A0A328YRU8_9BURK|nr:hypothetical protein [Paracidovorax anthurii]RAR76751.1 hypothetical protein AX018_104327 [Paracidovorax anthurii]